VERTRFRETTHGFRQKGTQQAAAAPPKDETASVQKSEKPGKKEKIRYGQAPTTTLPKASSGAVEDAGAVQVASSGDQPVNPLENAPPQKKTRFSDRAKIKKPAKTKGAEKEDPNAPAPPDAAEVADRQTQSAPLGPADKSAKKKQAAGTAGEKTRMSDRKKEPGPEQTQQPTPIPAVPGAPAPTQQQPPAQTPPATQPAQPQ
jgi:peptidyl-prolyl cis-trans isomerase SurA